ncbi:lysine N(6)-hydroxylase/L-ornithine N(5)-oxygenase family protein [Bacillus altitudinis MN12]|uniref:lysine N(6)-hydroxylase/L-ornithine N(5)-oxygenase family protein n=1 Tax=Bacillus TaxID=1386 RepID=UPI00061A0BA1|nr:MULTISPECIES: lysine N(6)-hydroxylase/L-ornithine N(5)-oxygenase family protein [Bacillus]AKC65458.1 lysine 6-monooxygenase [Bacillus altitudinis]MBR0582180.1 lysine N(6)-hydroxylase/L-ornithine N(5)-oxygenase family protein [Bacillus altitudinis MN12]MBR0594791.1 lysine N(6)-hydroxylase/L-ornithine N(5)-oxygenase family protein [Bacillus altitudinis C16B11]MBR0610897.1 lysine N(6)-hydroxylase/L-ornithine N(5)-oxygenase family protein [Bacillus altitudinis]MBR0628190.1 lysine N(6)-hydroxyla
MTRFNKQNNVVDVIGIGIGPFNLGLAALSEEVDEIDALFFERSEAFHWHPGMLIEGTTLQVPFLADLVSMADVKSKYSFLNYLQEQNRLYSFYFLEDFHIPRKEYSHYCRWVADQLDSCRFGMNVESVSIVEKDGEKRYEVHVRHVKDQTVEVFESKHLVLGIGTQPAVPASLQPALGDRVFHSADYLKRKKEGCFKGKSVTVIGSGQSAAEVFYDILSDDEAKDIHWFTRSKGFFPMEYSNLGLEYFSPDYIDFFYELPQPKKDALLKQQDLLYKGISSAMIRDIYHLLYERSACGEQLNTVLQAMTEVNLIEETRDGLSLSCNQWVKEESFTHETDIVVLATGYQSVLPPFIDPISHHIQWDHQGRFQVEREYRLKTNTLGENDIFVQNAELHTHGVGAPDLGLGAYRNSVIINELARRPVYPLYQKHVFQTFGTHKHANTFEEIKG